MGGDSAVSVDEVRAVIARLVELAERAHEARQTFMWMTLHTAAESLADNLEVAQELADDAD